MNFSAFTSVVKVVYCKEQKIKSQSFRLGIHKVRLILNQVEAEEEKAHTNSDQYSRMLKWNRSMTLAKIDGSARSARTPITRSGFVQRRFDGFEQMKSCAVVHDSGCQYPFE